MRDYVCPDCGRYLSGINERTCIVACGNCGCVVKMSDLPAAHEDSGKHSPTIIFRGSGWTPRGEVENDKSTCDS